MDIDELLAEEEIVPCTLLVDGVNIPLWLAKNLSEKNMVRVELPPQYGEAARDKLLDGGVSVNLRAMGEYYYTVGREIAILRRDDDLRKFLLKTLSGPRYEKILDWSRSSARADASDLLDILTEEERELFYAGFHAHNHHLAWKARKMVRLQTSEVFAAEAKARKSS
ncbi:hypothetical protein CTAYLR_002936 [Chrysophaeum taylorii]|uniref:GINS subunit domain-containing protein n=1 Tax=Chrysophaeum taylorii TaxID=2483200 RepID=A0AAD7UM77_9STRA|nr:hypothetical protein CTAYLR_002936 [Chrysophaeum taylorii]